MASSFGGVVVAETVAKALNESDPNRLFDALRLYGFGMHLSPQKYTWLGTTGATAVNITTTSWFANASGGSKTPGLPQGATQALPAALIIGNVRVNTGPSGSLGHYYVADSSYTGAVYPGFMAGGATGATAAIGIALLSDDGSTLTFPAQVSGFVINYIPRSYVDVTSPFEHA